MAHTIRTKDGQTIEVDRIMDFGEMKDYMAIAGEAVYIRTLKGEYELITPIIEKINQIKDKLEP